jgi:hypothetical protein
MPEDDDQAGGRRSALARLAAAPGLTRPDRAACGGADRAAWGGQFIAAWDEAQAPGPGAAAGRRRLGGFPAPSIRLSLESQDIRAKTLPAGTQSCCSTRGFSRSVFVRRRLIA